MTRTVLFTILNIIGAYLLLGWLWTTIKAFLHAKHKAKFFTFRRFRFLLAFVFIIGTPILLMNWLGKPYDGIVYINQSSLWYSLVFCGGLSFITALIWLDYVLKLDVYNREKVWHVWAVFLLSVGASFFADPLYGLVKSMGFSLNGYPMNDFLYSVFSIGIIEEAIKIIPFILFFRFVKGLNEPFDYLLFASVSALGFAFAENVIYLNRYGPEVILARTFYATVAHMTFTSTVAYGFLLHKYRYSFLPKWLVYGLFFGAAVFAHGFYDFWLINPAVKMFSGFTTLFFMITIHLWFTMMNNAINISHYYSPSRTINNEAMRYQLIKNFFGLIAFSYTYVALTEGSKRGNSFLIDTSLVYGYMMFYLVAGLSRFNIIKGKFNPFSIPFNFIVPKFENKISEKNTEL